MGLRAPRPAAAPTRMSVVPARPSDLAATLSPGVRTLRPPPDRVGPLSKAREDSRLQGTGEPTPGGLTVPPRSDPTGSTPTVGITMVGSTATGAATTPPPGAGATRTGEAAGATGAGAWASAWGWATGWLPGATARPSTAWGTCRITILIMTTTMARAPEWRWPPLTITPSRSIP